MERISAYALPDPQCLEEYNTPYTLKMYIEKSKYCNKLSLELSKLIMEKEFLSIDKYKKIFK